MSSERSVPVLDLSPGASPVLSLLVGSASILAATAVLSSGLPAWATVLPACAVLLAGTRWIVVEGTRMAGRSIIRLVLLDAEESMVVERTGRQRSVRLVHGTVIGSSLVVIGLRPGRWQTRTVCIGRDALDRETFRRLRVRLNVSSRAAKRPPFRVARARGLIGRRETD